MGSNLLAIGVLLCGGLSCLILCAAVAIWAVTSSKRK
jgi:hypothetical protein